MNQYPSLVLYALIIFFIAGCNPAASTETLVEEAPVKTWLPEDTRDIPSMSAARGLITKTEEATPGYVLFHPSAGTSTYLMNLDGEIVHEWKGEFNSMQSYLMEDGRIFRMDRDPDFRVFAGGGQSGRIREYSWDGALLWDFKYANEKHLTHHDMAIMPNGNILVIAWEAKTAEESIAAGRNPELTPKAGLWPDKIIEIAPQRPSDGKIVWEWHLWDHLVQDYDSTKANFGKIADFPRKVNLNAHAHVPEMTPEQVKQLIKNGSMTSNATVENRGSDMTHVNAVTYNPQLDQIAISAAGFNEIWIIDHSTTTEEARGSTGGRWGHGGDLLYRWGDLSNYGRGGPQDQKLFGQHDIRWIQEGAPGAGNLMVFNNDIMGPGSKFPNAFAAMGALESIEISIADLSNYSAVHEFTPSVDANGAYLLSESGTFGPTDPSWSYIAPDKYSFYAPFVSGAHRMDNGHTFITSGPRGRFMEITEDGKIVWEYWNPYFQNYRLPDSTFAQPVGPFLFAQFRATHIPEDHPALANRTLTAINPQPEVFIPKPPPEK